MNGSDLWKRYCGFLDLDFSLQMVENRKNIQDYFSKWQKTDTAKMICPNGVVDFKDVPITQYSDYSMLNDFRQRISNEIAASPRLKGELAKHYWDRVAPDIVHQYDRYMVEPYSIGMQTTGTTGQAKWVLMGDTFWRNFTVGVISTAILACADSWGETKLEVGEKGLNISGQVPTLSGWSILAAKELVRPVPPVEMTDNLKDVKEVFSLVLQLIQKGEKLSLAGGVGSLFYMMCKHFTDPEEFYQEYYDSMNFSLQKMLLGLKLIQSRYSRSQVRRITELMPLKGVMVGGVESRLYIDFFKEEFGLQPLHNYGSTEGGVLMRGDPDRKTDLIPDLRNNYLEFQDSSGEIRDLDELKKGEVYNLIITPYGSILFRYDTEDLLRVIDSRDDGMPVFAFEGRKNAILRLYNFTVSPSVIVDSLAAAGLKSSDKWTVTKTVGDRERLHFIMEKTWPYCEEDAERLIFDSLMNVENRISDRFYTFKDLVSKMRIQKPSDALKVEYVRSGAFTRYSILKAREGAPMGQYKPPSIIPPEKCEICEKLRTV